MNFVSSGFVENERAVLKMLTSILKDRHVKKVVVHNYDNYIQCISLVMLIMNIRHKLMV